MSKPFRVVLLAVVVLTTASFAQGQQSMNNPPRVGYLTIFSPASSDATQRLEAFIKGLREIGYVEGKNTAIEQRSADGKEERLAPLAEELVRLKVDLIVVPNDLTARAAKRASATLPIVMLGSGNPIGTGVIASLARPGGTVTGVTSYSVELLGKRLALLKESLPKITRFAYLAETSPGTSASEEAFTESQATAKHLGVTLRMIQVDRRNPDFKQAFRIIANERIGAIIPAPSPIINVHQKQIQELIAQHRKPAIHGSARWVDAGGLMSYGPNILHQASRGAVFVDKILKGAKPAELPVEGPTKFDFVINLKTAKTLGVDIPQAVLFRADRVIK